MEAKKAPVYWARGKHALVPEYPAQDVKTTLDAARVSSERGMLKWVTKKGGIGTVSLGSGWLPVRDVLKIGAPDTSWMAEGDLRDDFTRWMKWSGR